MFRQLNAKHPRQWKPFVFSAVKRLANPGADAKFLTLTDWGMKTDVSTTREMRHLFNEGEALPRA